MSTQSSLTIAERLQSITQQLTELSKDIQHDPTVLGNGRTSLYEAAKVLLQTISQPMDFITNTMTGLGQFTAVRLFIEWKVFDTIPDEGSITYADLASNIGAEEELIRESNPYLMHPAIVLLTKDGRPFRSGPGCDGNSETNWFRQHLTFKRFPDIQISQSSDITCADGVSLSSFCINMPA